VSELSRDIKKPMEDAFGRVRVRGEISGFRGPHSSGHAYFAVKDEKARLEAVIWRGVYKSLPVKPEEGLEVIATGKITTYPGSSKYQIVIEQLEPAGVGALMALLEERRKKLAAEGLFDEDRKQQLPYLPRTIGVVTSPTGAVIRDILHRLSDRFPMNVIVWPVRVQGETSGAEVANAVNGYNALGPVDLIRRPDLLIVARGGGSLEDLWGFNDEAVVRAVATSDIPVISAVGHETDWTLIDYVADVRAPTPTGAAEIAVPVRSELLATVDDLGRRLHVSLHRGLDYRKDKLSGLARGLPRAEDLFAMPRQRFDHVAERLDRSLKSRVDTQRLRLERVAAGLSPHALKARVSRDVERTDALAERMGRALKVQMQTRSNRLNTSAKLLQSLSYKSILLRGFAVVRDADGIPLSSVKDMVTGQPIELELHDGRRSAHIGAGAPLSADTPPAVKVTTEKKRPPQKAKTADKNTQGELF